MSSSIFAALFPPAFCRMKLPSSTQGRKIHIKTIELNSINRQISIPEHRLLRTIPENPYPIRPQGSLRSVISDSIHVRQKKNNEGSLFCGAVQACRDLAPLSRRRSKPVAPRTRPSMRRQLAFSSARAAFPGYSALARAILWPGPASDAAQFRLAGIWRRIRVAEVSLQLPGKNLLCGANLLFSLLAPHFTGYSALARAILWPGPASDAAQFRLAGIWRRIRPKKHNEAGAAAPAFCSFLMFS